MAMLVYHRVTFDAIFVPVVYWPDLRPKGKFLKNFVQCCSTKLDMHLKFD